MLSARAILVVAILLTIPAAAFATEYFVDIPGFLFDPQNITVQEGDIVTWTNNHTFIHTSTSADGGIEWDSGILNPGDSFSHTFNAAGSFDYICAVHPTMMTGNVTVEPAASIPTLSEWGMIMLSLLLVLGGTFGVIRRRKTAIA